MENAVIIYKEGIISFHNYESILADAKELAEHISSVEVTEESVKQTKKMLAAVNKKVAELEDGRKQIKKEVLAPYEEFEKKVKSITSIIKEADNTIRSQVRELEEKDREEKQQLITNLFVLRQEHYPETAVFYPFDFIKPQHLNKTYSLTKVEGEMVEWFETTRKNIEFITGLDNGDDVLVEYIKTQNLLESIEIVKARNEIKETISSTARYLTTFTITANSEFEALAIEELLRVNQITYKRSN